MSLHGKVVAWFAFFASVIVTMFVLGDYYQSTRALRVALEARAQALAGQTATGIERRYEHAVSDLREFGREVAQRNVAAPSTELADFQSIRVLRDGRPVVDHAVPGGDAGTCYSGVVPFEIGFQGLDGRAYVVEATMTARSFLRPISAVSAPLGQAGIASVVETGTGSSIFDAGCALGTARMRQFQQQLAERVRRPLPATHLLEVRPRGTEDRYLVATATAAYPSWAAAVAFDYDEWAAPFVSARTQYLAIMIAIMLIVLAFTLRMIRVDMRRLSAISRAADEVGEGRFDVWLPPPTGDEVGRLSLAIGHMVNRLASTVRQAEVTAAMAAVGELATYLSHEIRNPLSSLRLNLQMLRRDVRNGRAADDAQELLDICLGEMQRLDEVVKTVLDVGRRGSRQTGVCNAHDVVDETVQLMRSRLAGQGVEVQTQLAAPRSEVAIDASQLKSVLINLILNAVDAMAGSPVKRLLIATGESGMGAERPFVLRVLDTGPGVPPDLAERIFEPFFTTKAAGSGIGLATAARMIRESNGTLRCIAAQDAAAGGEFVLELPLAAAVAGAPEPEALAVVG